MSSIRDFKKIADENMVDIKVSDQLKEKTLNKCRKKASVRMSKYLVPVACAAVILVTINLLGTLPKKDNIPEQEFATDMQIMTESTNKDSIFAVESTVSPSSVDEKTKKWALGLPEEAQKAFGTEFLTPEYIPKSFQREGIQAFGQDEQNADKIILNYFDGTQSFLIIEEKIEKPNSFTGYKSIDINDTNGYVKNESKLDTEVHWYKEGVHYSVAGQISEEEAIKVALSMKK